ncbi:hypothetical protein [uncultured Duncaniella sp.]|uniref:hypothetical protein n=1 Tax=uncultured Duncaniella sp. TaxID=2768039 RepID=UPI002711E618|nr:hypothetical protein [uncultured Duncaniella sp.]
MRKLALLFFMSLLSFISYAQHGNRGRMSDLSDDYGVRDNEFMIPLIILLILGGLFLKAWIKGNSNKK